MSVADGVTQARKVRAHLLLPETDGSIVENFREFPQQSLLTDSLWPVLCRRHPDGQFAVGADSGIYWKETDPPLGGCKAPDWFYVPGVPPLLDGEFRRSYVLWEELVPPEIILEIASRTGREERDRTPGSGKFWVYEQKIRCPFYGIFDSWTGDLEAFQLVEGVYERVSRNEWDRYPIAALGVELGVWCGTYRSQDVPWLRWWDDQGRLLPTSEERADDERQRADDERQRANNERQRANNERQRANNERQRADDERQRAETAISEAEKDRQRTNILADRLRALGINPDEI